MHCRATAADVERLAPVTESVCADPPGKDPGETDAIWGPGCAVTTKASASVTMTPSGLATTRS